MKKNLILAVCFTLVFGVASAMADTLVGDKMLAYGTAHGSLSDRAAAQLFTYYSGDTYTRCTNDSYGCTSMNGTVTSVQMQNMDVWILDVPKNNSDDRIWTYAIVYSNTNGSGATPWYLFENSYSGDDEEYLYSLVVNTDILFTVDVWTISGKNATFTNETIDIYAPTIEQNTNRGYYMWEYGGDFQCEDCVVLPPVGNAPEPGSIILLGTGIIGLGFAARRKMNKK